MNNPLDIRFVPKWLAGVIKHYGTDVTNFESIVSRHDAKLYKLANNLLRTKFELMRVKDFNFPAADIEGQYSEDDALFALYGHNPEGKTVPQFHLERFVLRDDGKGGAILLETGEGDPKDLCHELLLALDAQRGRACTYDSDSFKRYLVSVNNDHINTTDENLHNLVSPPASRPVGGGDPDDGSGNGAKP